MASYMPCPICGGRLYCGQPRAIIVNGVPCIKRYRRCVPCGVSIRTLEVPLKGKDLNKLIQAKAVRGQASKLLADLVEIEVSKHG